MHSEEFPILSQAKRHSLRVFLCMWHTGKYCHVRAMSAAGARCKTGCDKAIPVNAAALHRAA